VLVWRYEWQVEQLPPEQAPQLEAVLEDASRGPLVCTANALKSLVTLSLLQAGHSTVSSADLINTSKSERHWVQLYSYRGMDFLVLCRVSIYSQLYKIYRTERKKETGENICFPAVQRINVHCRKGHYTVKGEIDVIKG
jgi:hypothetical protein